MVLHGFFLFKTLMAWSYDAASPTVSTNNLRFCVELYSRCSLGLSKKRLQKGLVKEWYFLNGIRYLLEKGLATQQVENLVEMVEIVNPETIGAMVATNHTVNEK